MKIILSGNTVIAVKEDSFVLAATDTDVSIMPWAGDEPELGSVLSNNTFVTPWSVMNDDAKLNSIRATRINLLAPTDFMISRHIEQETRMIPTLLSPAQYNEVLAYRQALRDMPSTADLTAASFDLIQWPTVPSFL